MKKISFFSIMYMKGKSAVLIYVIDWHALCLYNISLIKLRWLVSRNSNASCFHHNDVQCKFACCLVPRSFILHARTDLLTVPSTFFTIILLPILIEGLAHCLPTLGILPTGNFGFLIVIEPSSNVYKTLIYSKTLTHLLVECRFQNSNLAKLQFN